MNTISLLHLDYLLRTLSIIKGQCEKSKRDVSKIDQVMSAIDKMSSPVVGVFGAQKRGKSTLINRLIGGDLELMPVKAMVASSVAIMVSHNASMKEAEYQILIRLEGGKEELHTRKTLEEARLLIVSYGSHQGNAHKNVEVIEVEGNFGKSKLLKANCILLDTPGAENCVERAHSADDDRNAQDTKRALSMLETARVVLFLESVDYYQSNNSVEFYRSYIRDLPHLFALNKQDKMLKAARGTGRSEEELKQEVKTQLFDKWQCHKMNDIHFLSAKSQSATDGVASLEDAILQHVQSVCIYELLSRVKFILADLGEARERLLRPARLQFTNFSEAYHDYLQKENRGSIMGAEKFKNTTDDLKKVIDEIKTMF